MSHLRTNKNLILGNYSVPLLITKSTKYSRLSNVLSTISIPAKSTTYTNFPIYINANDLTDRFWSVVGGGDGSNIKVFDIDGNILPTYIRIIDSANKLGSLYFKANLTTSENVFTIQESTDSALSTVWSDYTYVNHMEGTLSDLSDNKFGISSNGVTGGSSPIIDGSKILSGSGSFIRTISNCGLSGDLNLTVSCWVRYITQDNSTTYFFCMGTHTNTRNLFALGRRNSNWYFHGYFEDYEFNHSSDTDGLWHYHTVVHNPSTNTIRWYVDGVLVNIRNTGGVYQLVNAPIMVGARVTINNYTSISNPSNIEVDEVEVFNGIRDISWISEQYNNRNLPSSYYTIS